MRSIDDDDDDKEEEEEADLCMSLGDIQKYIKMYDGQCIFLHYHQCLSFNVKDLDVKLVCVISSACIDQWRLVRSNIDGANIMAL